MKALLGTTVKIGNYTVTLKEKIGEGGYAWVFLAEDQMKTPYAVKYVKCLESNKFKQFKNEATFLQSLPQHPHIVKLYAADVDEHNLSIKFLFEYAPGTCIGMMQERQLTDQEILVFFHAICDAVGFLHSRNPPIIHRDLKPENILISSTGIPKLCDFGSATTSVFIANDTNEINYLKLEIDNNTTMSYRAPEMVDFFRKVPISTPSDVWALGCTLYKLITRQELFKPEDTLAILQGRINIPNGCSPLYQQILQACIQVDPSKRPAAAQLATTLLKARGQTDYVAIPQKNANRNEPTIENPILGFIKETYRSVTSSGLEKTIIKASFLSDKPPKTKHVRRLIIASMKDPQAMKQITQYLVTGRNWNEDPRIAAKVLYLILTLLQIQPNLGAFVPLTVKTDEILKFYSSNKFGDTFHSCLVAIDQLGNIIRIKLMLHAAHPELEGNFYTSGGNDSSLRDDINRYFASVVTSSRAMMDSINSVDSFFAEVLSLPILKELAASGAVLNNLDPSNELLQIAKEIINISKRYDYLSSALSAEWDDLPKKISKNL